MTEKRHEVVNGNESSNLPQVYYVDSNRSIYGEESSVNMKDFVIGALVGGIVGAAAGLLLAPKAGSELRGDVAHQAVNIKEKSVELSQQLKDQSTHLVDKVKSKTSKAPTVFDDGTVSSEGEEPLDEVVSAVEDVIAEATEGIEAVADAAEEKLDGAEISKASRPSSI